MASHVNGEFGVSMSEQDIRNQLQKLRVERLGPYTSTQIFVNALQDFLDNVSFAQIHRNEDTGKIDAVFWTYNSEAVGGFCRRNSDRLPQSVLCIYRAGI